MGSPHMGFCRALSRSSDLVQATSSGDLQARGFEPLQLSLGPEIRLSKYLAASRGFRVSREEDGLAGSGSPLPLGGPQARDVLSFASAEPRAARPSQQAGSGGEGAAAGPG